MNAKLHKYTHNCYYIGSRLLVLLHIFLFLAPSSSFRQMHASNGGLGNKIFSQETYLILPGCR